MNPTAVLTQANNSDKPAISAVIPSQFTLESDPRAATMDSGQSQETREAIALGLARLLADTYTLYLKTHNYHWNVSGPMFNTLHAMFEQQYSELALAVDEVAERIRALGYMAPGSYSQFALLTSITEANRIPEATDMVAELARDQETAARTAQDTMALVEQSGDAPTADLLTRRMQIHQHTAWMLRSLAP